MPIPSAALQSGANILDRLISEQLGVHGEEASELLDALSRRATHPLRRGGYVDAVARRDDVHARARGSDPAARARALGVEPRVIAVREAALPRGVAVAIGAVSRFHAQGLLPELGLAWISLDVNGGREFELLLWDYEASPRPVSEPAPPPYGSHEVRVIRGFSAPVVGVALVAPRGDRFTTAPALGERAAVASLLLIASTRAAVHIFVLETERDVGIGGGGSGDGGAPRGLALSALWGDGEDRVDALPGALVIPADGILLAHFAGTPSGRIFAGGDDGFVYELEFGAWGAVEAPTGAVALVSALARAGVDLAARLLSVGGARLDAPARARLVNVSASPAYLALAALARFPAGDGKPIISLTHDHERGLLWALRSDSRIAVWSTIPVSTNDRAIRAPGSGYDATLTRPVGNIDDLDDSVRRALNSSSQLLFAGGLSVADFEKGSGEATPLHSLSIVPVSESRAIHAIAISAKGTRFYLTTYTGASSATPLAAARSRASNMGTGGGGVFLYCYCCC